MQANKSKLILAGLLAANAANALNLGNEQAPTAPAALAQIQAASAVQAKLETTAEAKIRSGAADPRETPRERREREAMEKVEQIFDKILDGVETKREEALEWLIELGDELIDEVHDKADSLVKSLATLADNRVDDMHALAATIQATVDKGLAEAKAEIARLKAEAADGITEKRKEAMYAIKDLKIEIGTTFKKAKKAEKKAQIESHVSELESFINKTIREYDEGVAHQIDKVGATTQAAWQALENEKLDAQQAFSDAKGPAENELDGEINKELLALEAAFDEKNAAATEVHTYLTENFTRYLDELLTHVFEGASEAERDDLMAAAITEKDDFFTEVMKLNTQLSTAMTRKMAKIVTQINQVKSGKDQKKKHDKRGRIAKDEDGNPIILQEAVVGYVGQVMDVYDAMVTEIDTYLATQKENNSSANKAAGDADTESSNWLDDAARNELAILADFLEQGFAFHVDTADFIEHTKNPYAPFSTGDYNELVDQINGFEQFFHYWKRTKERAIDVLASCKHAEKSIVSQSVFEVDIPALEKVADDLLIATNSAAESARVEGEQALQLARKNDTKARDLLEGRMNKTKAKIFREIGFMVKKLYRATREEYKHEIKANLEKTITTFNEVLDDAKEELKELHKTSAAAEATSDETIHTAFKSMWVDAQLVKFDEYDEETSPETIITLETFRDVTMDAKIATARAEVDAGLTKKERDIKAAYEAVKLKISKIEDHHFQYNVRTLLEDAKAEADRRCAHEDHDTNAIVDGVEAWVWDFTTESMERYNEKVKAEREALAAGLNAAADRVWEDAGEHQAILDEHQEHEKHALEYFVKDCVKGLKHLFNRYGYVSPQFEEKEHQHGTGYPHAHINTDIDPEKVVDTLHIDPDNKHKLKDQEERKELQEKREKGELEEWEFKSEECEGEGCEVLEDESRSSCTGSSCDNPLIIDGGHHEIQLDSLEDLAHVIDDEVIHRKPNHEHVPPRGPQEPREYEPFIDDDPDNGQDSNPVKVAPVKEPEKHFLPKPDYTMPSRFKQEYVIDEIPLFDLGYKQIIKTHDHSDSEEEEEHAHGHKDEAHAHDHHEHEEVFEPALTPAPTQHYGSLAPEKPKQVDKATTVVDDVWGNYLAKWKKPTEKKTHKPVSEWKPTSFQPFDFGNYGLRGRAPAVTDEPPAPRKAYWWEQPKAARAPGKQLAWWERLTLGGEHLKGAGKAYAPEPAYVAPEPAYVAPPPVHSKPAAYTPYVPRSTYTPKVRTQTANSGKYWWQK